MRNFRGTLLGPLVKGVVRLFAKDPGRCFTRIPRGWGQVFRNAGAVSVEHDPESDEARLRVEDACDAFFAAGYTDGLCGGFEAVYDVTDSEGGIAPMKGAEQQGPALTRAASSRRRSDRAPVS